MSFLCYGDGIKAVNISKGNRDLLIYIKYKVVSLLSRYSFKK